MDNALELSHVSFQYKSANHPALNDISFSLARGECAVVMGPSASGKTTLCRCLNGLVPQALEGTLTGEVTVAGKDVSTFRVQTLAKDVGFVMQDPEVQIVGRTVREDLAFGPRNFLVPAAEIEKRIPRVLAHVGLQGYEDRSTAALSGGEKQRLAIAGILAMAPGILVLDEPASELDPAGRTELYRHLDQLRQRQGLTLVIVEQKIEDILPMVDQVLMMTAGRLKAQGRPEQIQKNLIPPCCSPPPLPGKQCSPVRNFIPRTLKDKPGSPPENPVLLEVKQLNFQYTPSIPILKNIHLTIRQKDFTAVMGHNGAGKTTLVKHLNGLLPCTSGTLLFCKKEMKRMTIRERARSVGFVFQNPDHQIFENSVEKEISFGLTGMGLSREEITRRVDEALDRTGIESVRHHHPFTVGKGTRQMIAVASIVALRPRILVVDEPTTGLDETGGRRIMDLIKNLHTRGTAIVLITHDLNLAAQYADRLVVMTRGEIVVDDDMETALAAREILKRAGLSSPQETPHRTTENKSI